MKAEGRVELFCKKTLQSGHIDSFRVVVSKDDVSGAKSKYKAMGYEVITK